jgi:hypothetical protein
MSSGLLEDPPLASRSASRWNPPEEARECSEPRVLGDATMLADSVVVEALKAQYEEKEARQTL